MPKKLQERRNSQIRFDAGHSEETVLKQFRGSLSNATQSSSEPSLDTEDSLSMATRCSKESIASDYSDRLHRPYVGGPSAWAYEAARVDYAAKRNRKKMMSTTCGNPVLSCKSILVGLAPSPNMSFDCEESTSAEIENSGGRNSSSIGADNTSVSTTTEIPHGQSSLFGGKPYRPFVQGPATPNGLDYKAPVPQPQENTHAPPFRTSSFIRRFIGYI